MLRFPSSLLAALCLLISGAKAYSVNGKRVLVTGSSGGIGRGLAVMLAEQGAEVFVHYNQRQEGARETRRLIEQAGGKCAGISQCDFSHPANIHNLFQQINGVWRDGMDILINNAGVISKLACEDDDDYVTQWRDTMNINLNAPRLLSQLALRLMKQRGGGVVINVSSIHGQRSNEYMSAYAVSKAGLDALTRCMAIEFAEYKVRVNAIAPGVVKVERTEELFRDPANVDPWKERLLLNEIGEVKNVAEATLPLITNDWITGSIWQIDGGMSARSNMPLRARPRGYTSASPPASEIGGGRPPNEPLPDGGAYRGERQVGSGPGFNAGRMADDPMSAGQPSYRETTSRRGRGPDPSLIEPGSPGYGEPGRSPPRDPRGPPPEDYGRPGMPPPGPGMGTGPMPPGPGRGPMPSSGFDPNLDRSPYGRGPPDMDRRGPPPPQDMDRRGPPAFDENRQDFAGRKMNDPGQNGYGAGGMPGQGYIPRSGHEHTGGKPGDAGYGQRGGRSDDNYRPLDDPNDPNKRGWNNPRGRP